jgi:transcriptional regulator with XRE-family HTH domain
MNFRSVFGEVVREQRQAQDLQLRDLAEKSFLSYSYLSELERGLKECSSSTMECIANGLGVKLYDLIIETGYRLAGNDIVVPDTPETLFVRDSKWYDQYADLT